MSAKDDQTVGSYKTARETNSEFEEVIKEKFADNSTKQSPQAAIQSAELFQQGQPEKPTIILDHIEEDIIEDADLSENENIRIPLTSPNSASPLQNY